MKTPVIDFALSSACEFLFALNLPAGASPTEARKYLTDWSRGITQAAYRERGRLYWNLPRFSACRQTDKRGTSRWLVAAQFIQIRVSVEELALRHWNQIAPGCLTQVLCYPGTHVDTTKRCFMQGLALDEFVSSTDIGVPMAEPPGPRSDIGDEPTAPSSFFQEKWVPDWADLRIWTSTNAEAQFGFSTYVDRNGTGSCLLANYFYRDGDDVVTNVRSIPALHNNLGICLQALLADHLPKLIQVSPIPRSDRMRFKSGDDLLRAVTDWQHVS